MQLREAELARPVAVSVGGKTYDVRPGEALMVDAAATQAALVRTGHDSFLRRVRRLVDPSPPTLLVDPVLVPRPGADERRRAPLRRAAEAPAGAGRDAPRVSSR